jgi:hypothetical protein
MIISMVLSVAAFLSALFITHYCSYNTNACCDSNSVIVGAFGVIVTLLVGWQIYKTVDIDKKINKKIEGQDTRIESTEGSITTKAEELRSGFRKDIEQLKETIDMRGEFSAEKITMMVQELVNLGLSDKEIYGFVGKCIHTPTGYFIKALEKAREKPKEDN